MKITLKDRILLPSIFPVQGKFETLIIIEDIKKKILITQKELSEFEMKTVGNEITWNTEGEKRDFDIKFTEIEKETIKELLKKLSEEGKLSIDLINIYKLFVK